jgi:hypothetical protein
MARIIYKSPEQLMIEKVAKYYDAAKKKQFNYSKEDFHIIDLENGEFGVACKKWANGVIITDSTRNMTSMEQAEKLVDAYVEDANKPYGERGKVVFHLIPIENLKISI